MNDSDPTDIAAIEQREAEAQAKSKRLVEQEIEDLKWFMSDKRGRRLMWRLLERTGTFANPFAGGVEQTSFNCGKMLIGQDYLGSLNNHCPERYNQMITENMQ